MLSSRLKVFTVKVFIPLCEPLEVTKCEKCGKIIAEQKELIDFWKTQEKYRNWHLWMKVVELHIRTVAAILMLFVLALLILNKFLRSGWIWMISIAMLIIAVIVYFIPRLRKWYTFITSCSLSQMWKNNSIEDCFLNL